jgi:hypothetical protein
MDERLVREQQTKPLTSTSTSPAADGDVEMRHLSNSALVSMGACNLLQQTHQNEHALLISLLSRLFLVIVGLRQGFVYGCHGEVWGLWMCLRSLLRLQKKFENI